MEIWRYNFKNNNNKLIIKREKIWTLTIFIGRHVTITTNNLQNNMTMNIVRTYVFHLLRTYVIHLCNWLILWQNTLYLYLGRYRMCLIHQETCCSSLVLKPWRLDQETSEEKLFIKVGQIARHLLIVGGSIEKAPVSLTAPQ